MKKTTLTLIAVMLFSWISASAAPTVEIKTTDTTNINRFYVGPEFFVSHYEGGFDKKTHGADFHYHRNVYYGGLRLGYELLKPRALYVATDGVVALGATQASIKHEKRQIQHDHAAAKRHIASVLKGHRGHAWANIEQLFGYTFASSLIPRCTVTLFAGPGLHYEHADQRSSHWWYATTGIKALQQFQKHFHFGCDFKIMLAFDPHDSLLTLPTTLGKNAFWGYQIGLPFEWAVGDENAFDIQLRPYLLKLNGNSPETILGASFALGYNF